MNNTQLISFETKDMLKLPGLFYEPEKKSRKAAIFLHGNGSFSIFYKQKKMEIFARFLNQGGWAFLPFNNRGAHYIKKFSWKKGAVQKEKKVGMSLELIEDCILDISASIEFLKNRGYSEFVLIGESSGANKICVYHHLITDNPIKGYALVGGGDDTGLWFQMLGKEHYFQLLNESQKKTDSGKGEELLFIGENQTIMSYQSLFDTLNPDGLYNCFPFYEYFSGEKLSKKPLFRLFKELNRPTFILYGSEDKYCYQHPSEVTATLKKTHHRPELLTIKVVQDADHSFSDHEEVEARSIVEWLKNL